MTDPKEPTMPDRRIRPLTLVEQSELRAASAAVEVAEAELAARQSARHELWVRLVSDGVLHRDIAVVSGVARQAVSYAVARDRDESPEIM